MVKNHLKRLSAPKTWKIQRKTTVFIAKSNPGPHSLQYGIPISVALTEFLHITKNTKEVNVILQDNQVLVDGIVRKDSRFTVGLFDAFEIKKTKQHFRITINKNGFIDLITIDPSESQIKPCKIIGKTMVGKKIQLHLYDGKNILTDNPAFKVGDTVLLALPKLEIKEHIPFGKNKLIFLMLGKHAGKVGVVEDIKGKNIVYRDSSGTSFETLKKYAFVIGHDKPAITL